MSLRASKSGQVGIDLGGDVAGQEAEAFAGLDGGSHQDDLLDQSLAQHAHGHADGQPRIMVNNSSSHEAMLAWHRQIIDLGKTSLDMRNLTPKKMSINKPF